MASARRLRRSAALVGASVLAAVAGSEPARASLTGPGVQPPHNITAFHNIDFVAVFGYPVGARVTVDLVRAGHRVASATGAAAATPDGGALEVNHGPAGVPRPGDCWENYTPDVRPGDQIQVRHAGATEEVTVDEITIDQAPALLPDGTIEVRGIARTAAGAPIGAARLDSGEVRNVSTRVRANPSEVVDDPLREGGWIARYLPPGYGVFRGDNGNEAFRRQSVLTGDHAMGFGHVVPLPRESMVVEGLGEGSGPALGCEASPASANAVGTSSVEAINQAALAAAPAAGDAVLEIGGSAAADVTSIAPSLSDGTTTIAPSSVTMGANRAGDPQGWSATFARSEILRLRDGIVTAAATFTPAVGAPTAGRPMTLKKDLVAPSVVSDPVPGTYQGALDVSLSAGGASVLTYRTDGAPAGPGDTRFGTPITLQPGAGTVSAYAEDAAGNTTRATFAFTITAPPSPPGPGSAPPPARAAEVLAPGAPALAPLGRPALRLERLVTRGRVSRRSVRARGLSLLAGVPRGTRLLRIEVLRRSRTGRLSRVTETVRALDTDGVLQFVLRAAAVRRALTPGRYVVRVTPEGEDRSLGQTSSVGVRVTR